MTGFLKVDKQNWHFLRNNMVTIMKHFLGFQLSDLVLKKLSYLLLHLEPYFLKQMNLENKFTCRVQLRSGSVRVNPFDQEICIILAKDKIIERLLSEKRGYDISESD
jgi:hypothetical protein